MLDDELEVLRQKMTKIVKYSKYSKLINTENFNLQKMIDISRTCSLTKGPIKLTTKIDKYFGLSLFGSSDVSSVPFENSD